MYSPGVLVCPAYGGIGAGRGTATTESLVSRSFLFIISVGRVPKKPDKRVRLSRLWRDWCGGRAEMVTDKLPPVSIQAEDLRQ